jgi:ATP-dependent DNA helicase RecG
MFQMLGAGDKAGSGVDKIRRSWKDQHWQSPRVEETQQPDRVKWTLPLVSMLPEPILHGLESRFGDDFHQLDKDEAQTLVIAATEEGVTNQRLQESLPLHRRDITTLLQALVQNNFLVSEGIGRGTRYTVRGGELEFAQKPSSTEPPELDREPPELSSEPSELSRQAIKHDQEADLQLIAASVRQTQRSAPGEVKKVILALCRDRFLSLRDLSSLLARKPETLRGHYVASMVREGLLELRYPEKPSHRNQAYRTRSKGNEP